MLGPFVEAGFYNDLDWKKNLYGVLGFLAFLFIHSFRQNIFVETYKLHVLFLVLRIHWRIRTVPAIKDLTVQYGGV